jgi:hypothetical protein
VVVVHNPEVRTHSIKPSRQRCSILTDRERDDVVEQLLCCFDARQTQFPNPPPQPPHLASGSHHRPSLISREERGPVSRYLGRSSGIRFRSANQKTPPHPTHPCRSTTLTRIGVAHPHRLSLSIALTNLAAPQPANRIRRTVTSRSGTGSGCVGFLCLAACVRACVQVNVNVT